MKTSPESIALVLVASFLGSFGMVGLKAGAERAEISLGSLLRNWRLAVGVALFLLSSVFFVLAIRRGELTVLYPMVSLGYVWTLIWSRLFFGEPITRAKIGAVGLILLGVVLVAAGGR